MDSFVVVDVWAGVSSFMDGFCHAGFSKQQKQGGMCSVESHLSNRTFLWRFIFLFLAIMDFRSPVQKGHRMWWT